MVAPFRLLPFFSLFFPKWSRAITERRTSRNKMANFPSGNSTMLDRYARRTGRFEKG